METSSDIFTWKNFQINLGIQNYDEKNMEFFPVMMVDCLMNRETEYLDYFVEMAQNLYMPFIILT